MKILTVSIMALALVGTLSGCSNFISSTSSLSRAIGYTDTGVNKPDDFPVLRSSGYALISKQSGASYADKEIKAMRASKIEAYRELTEQVNGLYIKAHTSLNNTRQTGDSVSTEVEGYVHGARVIRQYPVGDTYVTELELDTRVIYDLYEMRGAL